MSADPFGGDLLGGGSSQPSGALGGGDLLGGPTFPDFAAYEDAALTIGFAFDK